MNFKELTEQLQQLRKENQMHFEMQVFGFAGPSRKNFRQSYMEFLTGKKLPKDKCGVHALMSAIINYKP